MPHSSASWRTRRASSAVSCSPSPAAGSSSRSTDGSVATARASATSRRFPNDSSSGRRSRSSSRPNSRTTAEAAGLSGALPGCTRSVKYASQSRLSAAVRRFSRTVMLSNSSRFWNERPTPATARLRADQVVTSSPSSSTRPAVGFAKPVSASINVDLPAPFGPIKPSTSFARTVIETPSSALDDAEPHPHALGLEVFGVMVGRPPSSSAPFVTCFTHLRDEAREAVRHSEQNHEDEDPERELHGRLALEEVAERVGDDRARREGGADDRTRDVADAADHCVEHDEDRLEHRERRIEDDARPAEPDEHAAHGRDRGPSPNVELGSDDADAERSGGALVRAHRDEPSSGALSAGWRRRTPARRSTRAQHGVPLGMGGGVEVEPEERDRADLRAGDAAGAPRVVEDQALDDEEAERRDGGSPSRAERGKPTRRPTGTVPAMPITAASSKGSRSSRRGAAIQAPVPASANCASESCPRSRSRRRARARRSPSSRSSSRPRRRWSAGRSR